MNKAALDKFSETYRYNSPQDDVIRTLVVENFKPFMEEGGIGLEVGCSNGFMTELWAKELEEIDVVEPAQSFIEMAKARNIPNVTFHNALLEEFETEDEYDYIFISYVLPIVEDDIKLLKKAKELLAEDGLIYIVVANANALSRQLAKHMGLVEDLLELTENEKNHGHKRAYDLPKLKSTIDKSGLDIIDSGGIFLKPFADFQMDEMIKQKIIGQKQIDGLAALGADYPELCGAIYAVCK